MLHSDRSGAQTLDRMTKPDADEIRVPTRSSVIALKWMVGLVRRRRMSDKVEDGSIVVGCARWQKVVCRVRS